jgi:hypothetical protein
LTIDLDKELPDTFKDLMYNEDRFLFLGGTAGSGKSVFAVKKTVVRALMNPEKFLVARKVQNTVKRSIFEEYKRYIQDSGLRNRRYYRSHDTDLTIWLADSIFLFTGMDDREKLKSISGITSAVLEELTEFDLEDMDQVNIRIRGQTPSYKQIIGMYNRIDEGHWLRDEEEKNNRPNTTFHSSSYVDNPFIDEEYRGVLEAYKNTNPYFYDVYTMGLWGQLSNESKFLYAYDSNKHVQECFLIKDLPLKLSFDFNIEPFATLVYQMPDKDTMNIIEEIQLDNSDMPSVCDVIKAKYPGMALMVTGDKSGASRSGVTRGKITYWQVVQKELGLHDYQIRLRSKNLDLVSSRILCNSAFYNKNIAMSPTCTQLKKDCRSAIVDIYGILVKDRNKYKNDFFDCLRYACDIEWPDLHLLKH